MTIEEKPFPCYAGKLLGALSGMGPSRQIVYFTVLLRIYEARGGCRDSSEVLSRRTGLPRAKVEDAIDWLVCEGKLAQTEEGLVNGFAQEILGAEESTVESRKIAGAKGGKQRAEKAQRNQRIAPSKTQAPLEAKIVDRVLDTDSDLSKSEKTDSWPRDAFDRFWGIAPRRVSKAAALKAFDRVRKAGAVPWDRFWTGAERWARWARTKDPQYVKHPATWINQGCWDDELMPEGGGGEHAQAYGANDRFGTEGHRHSPGAAAGAARGTTNGARILAGMGRLAGRSAGPGDAPGQGGDSIPVERTAEVVPLRARRD